MVSRRRNNLIFPSFGWCLALLLLGASWMGCGSDKSLSSMDESMALSKPARAEASKATSGAAVVVLTVTQNGAPVSGASVAVSKSIAGQTPNYQWTGTTDAQGEVTIEITDGTANNAKVSGYYMAKVTTASGTVIGTWTSMVVQAGTSNSYKCAAGKPTRTVWYVRADNSTTGAGTQDNPFNSLAEVMDVSALGDEIRIIPSTTVLEGGITLKDRQKLIGLGGDPRNLSSNAARAAITCSEPGVSAVTLGNDNEVANVQILDTNQGDGVQGSDVQNAYVHNCLFTRVGGNSINLNVVTPGLISGGHVIKDCMVTGTPDRPGKGTSGIALITTQNGGSLEAQVERVTVADLGGTGIRSGITLRNNAQPGTAGGNLTAVLRDVVVENVSGNAQRAVWAFSYGGAQNVTLDGCRIANCPGVNGFDISLNPETVGPFGPFPAHQGQYKIQNSDVIGVKTGVLVAPNPRTDSNAIIDLGGGSLGSTGMNRLYDNDVDLNIGTYAASATSNWWGSDLTPVITTGSGVPSVPTAPILTASPR